MWYQCNTVVKISIHALLAESDPQTEQTPPPFWISIHALLAESDLHEALHGRGLLPFLSTLSLRRATPFSRCVPMMRPYFYPRSPCGERPHADFDASKSAKISIHALLAESDQRGSGRRSGQPYFYPRSPCGERRYPAAACRPRAAISIHALLAESDSRRF